MTDERILAVTMPKWGLSMQVGKIIGWMVAPGDDVRVGDELADIETDKIAGTLEANSSGTVRRIVARVGEDVPVSGTIALIAPPDVSDDDLDALVQDARAVIEAGVSDETTGEPQNRRELKPLTGQPFAEEGLVTRQIVDDLLAYKRLDGVDAALHALLRTLLDGDKQRADSTASLAAIGGAVPVTVVWGAADRIIPPAQASSVAGAVCHLLDGTGHMPHMERPAEVLAAIEEAIARAG